MDLAVALVTLLSAEGGVNPNVHAIFAPDSTGKLTLSTDLVSNDNNKHDCNMITLSIITLFHTLSNQHTFQTLSNQHTYYSTTTTFSFNTPTIQQP